MSKKSSFLSLSLSLFVGKHLRLIISLCKLFRYNIESFCDNDFFNLLQYIE